MAPISRTRARKAQPVPEPLIGSYLLESITTGMYGERRNAIREYVQNSFDGIQAAVEARTLKVGAGRVTVTLSTDQKTLKIVDNGAGLSRRNAVDILTAVGASKKRRGHAAGFRGIGRLAGVAFCRALEFKTKASGEDIETTVTFDCDELRRGMLNAGRKPAAELIVTATSFEENAVVGGRKSYFEVTLRGLRDAPVEATDVVHLTTFLSQVAPVDFHPDFANLGAQIYELADAETTSRDVDFELSDEDEEKVEPDDEFELDEYDVEEVGPAVDWEFLDEDGADTMLERVPAPHIQLFIRVGDRGEEKQVFKPYVPKLGLADSKVVPISHVNVITGASKAWWGWIGYKTKPGEYEDDAVAGIRFRLKNIQIDGNDLIQLVPDSNQIRSSFGRWSNWFVGEIHIDPRAVIPNARRDNFEEDERWSAIRREITEVCKTLTAEARRVSRQHQYSLEVLEKKISKYQDAAVKVTHAAKFDVSKANKLVADSDALQRGIEKANDGATAAAQVRLRSLSKELTTIKVSLLTKPSGAEADRIRAALRQEFMQKAFDILGDYLGLEDLEEVRAALEKAIK
jgi:hypothetical protein